jgi:hypothetical protein
MRGTEKQVVWAEEIEKSYQEGLRRMTSVLGNIPEGHRAEYEALVLVPAREMGKTCGDFAARWIDARKALPVFLGSISAERFGQELGGVLGSTFAKTPLGKWCLLEVSDELDLRQTPEEIVMNLTGDPSLGRVPVGWDPSRLSENAAGRILERATAAWEKDATAVILPDTVADQVRDEIASRGIRVIRQSEAR